MNSRGSSSASEADDQIAHYGRPLWSRCFSSVSRLCEWSIGFRWIGRRANRFADAHCPPYLASVELRPMSISAMRKNEIDTTSGKTKNRSASVSRAS